MPHGKQKYNGQRCTDERGSVAEYLSVICALRVRLPFMFFGIVFKVLCALFKNKTENNATYDLKIRGEVYWI